MGHHHIGEPRDSGGAGANQGRAAPNRGYARDRAPSHCTGKVRLLRDARGGHGGRHEDVKATLESWPNLPTTDSHSPQAFEARQRVKRAGFAELRGAFLRFGGPLTEPFLRLDKEIDDYSSQWIPRVNRVSGASQNIGVSADVYPQLDSIEHQAMTLREEAAGGMKLCRDELDQGN
jgi:hypothetical protein